MMTKPGTALSESPETCGCERVSKSDYAKLLGAVHDAETSSDPIARYQQILDDWKQKAGITETATTTTIRHTMAFPSTTPYFRLKAYLGQYQQALREQAAQAARGNNLTIESLRNPISI